LKLGSFIVISGRFHWERGFCAKKTRSTS